MSIAISSAVSGLHAAGVRLEASARRFATADASPTDTAPGATAQFDPSAEALEQVDARLSFLANAKTLEITQEMVKRLFELTDRS